MSNYYTLYLITYARGKYAVGGKVKPYHWSYFIEEDYQGSANMGLAHQLRGMPGGFYYEGPEQVDLRKSRRMKEKVEIEVVPRSQVDRVHELLSQIRIETLESSSWNCQDWALDGFDKLKKEGFVYDHQDKNSIKEWLKER